MPCLLAVAALVHALMAAPASASAPASQRAPRPEAVTAASLRQVVAGAGGRATLVNAWATWCLPCRKEMPDLLATRAALAGRGFRLVLVTTDFEAALPEAVEFLTAQGVDFRTYWKAQPDHEFIAGLDPEWSGALPYSALFDASGRRVASWEGQVSRSKIEAAARPLLLPEPRPGEGGDPP